jgi:hypothetical protein
MPRGERNSGSSSRRLSTGLSRSRLTSEKKAPDIGGGDQGFGVISKLREMVDNSNVSTASNGISPTNGRIHIGWEEPSGNRSTSLDRSAVCRRLALPQHDADRSLVGPAPPPCGSVPAVTVMASPGRCGQDAADQCVKTRY